MKKPINIKKILLNQEESTEQMNDPQKFHYDTSGIPDATSAVALSA
jgi:hypothetical protein